jgi:ABC-type dipeptide/oligopeptide/nickel transport system permease component
MKLSTLISLSLSTLLGVATGASAQGGGFTAGDLYLAGNIGLPGPHALVRVDPLSGHSAVVKQFSTIIGGTESLVFPLGGTGSLAHLILPAFTAGLGGAAWYARMMRSSTLDILSTDYIRTARAKGLRSLLVILRHVLPNALNPIITMAGMDIPWFIGGVVLVERVFDWPGLGRLAVEAIETVDVPLILGTVIFTSLIVVLSGILIDVMQGLVDPRIRYGRE